MVRNTLKLLTILIFSCVATLSKGATSSQLLNDNKQWLSLDGEQLLKMARQHCDAYACSDTAFLCYTILTERYSPQMERKEKLQCIEAFHQLWSIYFFQHSDYATSYDMLSKAISIVDEMKEPRIDVIIDMGAMYLTVAGSTNSKEMYRQAIQNFRQAFKIAIKSKTEADKKNADIAMINMLISAFGAQQIDSIDAEWQQYKAHRLKNGGEKEFRPQYAHTLHSYYKAVVHGDMDSAMRAIDSQIKLSDGDDASRFLYMSLINKNRVLRQKHSYQDAISVMKQAEQVAKELDMKDLLIGVYAQLDTLYNETHQNELHELYRDRYYQLNDSLSNYRQLKWVGQMEARSSISGISEQVRSLMEKSQRQSNVIQTLIVVALVIAVFSTITVMQNRRLKATNLKLYAQIQATINAEERQQASQRKHSDNATVASPPHRSSSMDSEESQALVEKIIDVMENSDEIFSPDFSIERLSALVGSKYRYVSQVINEQFDCNFNTYIAKYRIREACKRLSDVDNYGRLTFEAIANSVGYKSRSAFASAFKSVTGLTPSEYKNIAISQHKSGFDDQNS